MSARISLGKAGDPIAGEFGRLWPLGKDPARDTGPATRSCRYASPGPFATITRVIAP